MIRMARSEIVSHLAEQGHSREDEGSCDSTGTLPPVLDVADHERLGIMAMLNARGQYDHTLLHFEGPSHRDVTYSGGVGFFSGTP